MKNTNIGSCGPWVDAGDVAAFACAGTNVIVIAIQDRRDFDVYMTQIFFRALQTILPSLRGLNHSDQTRRDTQKYCFVIFVMLTDTRVGIVKKMGFTQLKVKFQLDRISSLWKIM